MAQVELGLAHDNPGLADVRDALDAQERGPPGDRHQNAGDRRIAGAAEAHDQVLDLAQALPVGIAQRPADDRGEVKDRRRLRGGRIHAVILEGLARERLR